MLNEYNCENCAHYPICARTEAWQGMIDELKTRKHFTDYDGASRLVSDIDWVRLTVTCSFYDPKMSKRL